MASHAQIEEWWAGRRCEGPHVKLDILGRYPVRVQPELEEATLAMERALLDTGYRDPTGPTGSYNCRQIGGSDTWSLHAYAVAIDIDYGENPYLRGETIARGFVTDPRFMLTEANVDAVEGIVNLDGDPIWRWLGWTIADTMHFQVDQPPDKCEVADMGMTTEQWAKTLRNPLDFDQMAVKGVITEAERDYWITVAVDNPEFNDLRLAVEVRNPLWT